jgi:hypothetical protein
MLKYGIVVPSLNLFASLVLLVKKKDDGWRFCVDYRKLNNITIKNKFPLCVIDEFLDEIAGDQYFTTIDLASRFNHIRMVLEDEAKTTFKTHHGHFQFRVMSNNFPVTYEFYFYNVYEKVCSCVYRCHSYLS